MQITDVRVRRVSGGVEGKLRAYCSVTFDDMFAVHDFRVVEGVHGLFVAMPSRKSGEKEYRDIVHPVTAEARTLIQRAVLTAYRSLQGQNPSVKRQEQVLDRPQDAAEPQGGAIELQEVQAEAEELAELQAFEAELPEAVEALHDPLSA